MNTETYTAGQQVTVTYRGKQYAGEVTRTFNSAKLGLRVTVYFQQDAKLYRRENFSPAEVAC